MIALGSRLIQLRHERGVTQETLAQHVGVSKAAVSKWENDQSTPDIALLPVLAAYFGVSVDALLDYRPRMTREELRAAHTRIAALFAQGEQEEALTQVRAMLRTYHADAEVLIEGATLLINHLLSPEGCGEAMEPLARAKEIGTASQQHEAACLYATCLMMQGKPEEAIEELRAFLRQPMSSTLLLAQAYLQAGKPDQAMEQTQWTAYCALIELISALGVWCVLPGAPAKALLEKLHGVERLFSLSQVHPVGIITVYIQCATGLMAAGDTDAALTALEDYVRIAREDCVSPMMLRAHAPFDAIESQLEELPLGKLPPVDERMARERIVRSVTDNPTFAPLRGNTRFEALAHKLRVQMNIPEDE